MGMFLSMSAVRGVPALAVVDVLRAFAENRGGKLERVPVLRPDDFEACVVRETNGNTTVRYPQDFMHWDEAAQFLSQNLKAPVFSFHIHDSDFWMYLLFVNGQPVDQFLPMPDYWEEAPDEAELKAWQGDALVVSRHFDIAPDRISRYLVRWTEDMDMEEKAYEDDEFGYEDWQLMDFIRRLGLTSPLGEDGEFAGESWRLECE